MKKNWKRQERKSMVIFVDEMSFWIIWLQGSHFSNRQKRVWNCVQKKKCKERWPSI